MDDVVILYKIYISDFIGLVLGWGIFLFPLIWKQFHGQIHLKSVSYGISLINKEVFVELVISVFLKESGYALAFSIQCNDIEWHACMEIRLGGIFVYEFLDLHVINMIGYVVDVI